MSFKVNYKYRKKAGIPVLSVDVIISINDGIVMVNRIFPPEGWALPGGFVEKNETLEAAARREMKEETGLDLENIRQFHAYSDPKRDSRFHTVSVVFTAKGAGKIKAGSDAGAADIFKLNGLPQTIAFDHRKIISDFKKGEY